jgi:hypothetical protein
MSFVCAYLYRGDLPMPKKWFSLPRFILLSGWIIIAGILTTTIHPAQSANSPSHYETYLPIIRHNYRAPIVPAGAIPGQPPPVFDLLTTENIDTAIRSHNSWLDEFDHALSFSNFNNTAYRVFEHQNGIHDSIHWRHANHWMVDIASVPLGDPVNGNILGGALISPNQSFQFQNGKFIVEADMAAGHQDYDENSNSAWGELIITTAPNPLYSRPNGLYGYDLFPGHWTLGCRLQPSRESICTLMDNTNRGLLNGGRTWEMSWFQHVGTTVYGGFPDSGLENYWRTCAGDQGDFGCRDRFRMEITATSVTLFVNGIKYFEQTGVPEMPAELLNGNLYVYYGSMVAGHQAPVIRYHWDKLTVNTNQPPSAAPGFVAP